MPTSTLTAKGQTTIPLAVREHLNLHAGDRLEFVLGGASEVALRPAATDVSELEGMLSHKVKRPVTVEEMNAAIRRRGGRKR